MYVLRLHIGTALLCQKLYSGEVAPNAGPYEWCLAILVLRLHVSSSLYQCPGSACVTIYARSVQCRPFILQRKKRMRRGEDDDGEAQEQADAEEEENRRTVGLTVCLPACLPITSSPSSHSPTDSLTPNLTYQIWVVPFRIALFDELQHLGRVALRRRVAQLSRSFGPEVLLHVALAVILRRRFCGASSTVLRLHIGTALLHQSPDGFEVAVRARVYEWCPAVLVLRLHGRSDLNERPGSTRVAFVARAMECCALSLQRTSIKMTATVERSQKSEEEQREEEE